MANIFDQIHAEAQPPTRMGMSGAGADEPTTPAAVNHNPGNLRDPKTGAFQQYGSHEEGFRALIGDIEDKQAGRTPNSKLTGDSSLYDFAAAYAPKKDKNDPKLYAQNLAKHLDVTPETPNGKIDSRALAAGVSKMEDGPNWKAIEGRVAAPAPRETLNQPAPQAAERAPNVFDQIHTEQNTPATKPHSLLDRAADTAKEYWNRVGQPVLDASQYFNTDPVKHQKASEAVQGFIEGIKNIPLQTQRALEATGREMVHGHPVQAATEAIGAIPVVGPQSQEIGSDLAAGQYENAVAHTGAMVTPFVAGPALGAAGDMIEAAPGAMRAAGEGLSRGAQAVSDFATSPSIVKALKRSSEGAVVGSAMHGNVPGMAVGGAARFVAEKLGEIGERRAAAAAGPAIPQLWNDLAGPGGYAKLTDVEQAQVRNIASRIQGGAQQETPQGPQAPRDPSYYGVQPQPAPEATPPAASPVQPAAAPPIAAPAPVETPAPANSATATAMESLAGLQKTQARLQVLNKLSPGGNYLKLSPEAQTAVRAVADANPSGPAPLAGEPMPAAAGALPGNAAGVVRPRQGPGQPPEIQMPGAASAGQPIPASAPPAGIEPAPADVAPPASQPSGPIAPGQQLPGPQGGPEAPPPPTPTSPPDFRSLTPEEFRSGLNVRTNEPTATLTQPVTIPFNKIKANPKALASVEPEAAARREGATAPITVIPDGKGGYWLDDGFHRYTNMLKNPPANVPVEIRFDPETSFALRNPANAQKVYEHFVKPAETEPPTLAEVGAMPAQEVNAATRPTRTPGVKGVGIDAKTLTDTLLKWKFSPDEAGAMNRKGWERLAFESGVQAPSAAVQAQTIFNLKRALGASSKSALDLVGELKQSLGASKDPLGIR